MSLSSIVPLLNDFGIAIQKYPEIPWLDVLSKGQLHSKAWLVERLYELDLRLGTVFIVGGWVGSLAAMMFAEKRLNLQKIRSFDVDPKCADIAETVNRSYMTHWQFKAITMDMFDMDYANCTYTTSNEGSSLIRTEIPDTIINTSCDHIENFSDWWDKIPDGKLVVVQNNDFVDGDKTHINTVSDLAEFSKQTPMSDVFFSGQLELMKYTRFMRMGIK